MQGYKQILLKDMLDELGEENTKTQLTMFSCPQNFDVECFIKQKAIEFAKQNISPTYLVYASYRDKPVLVGYYTITIKNFLIERSAVSKSLANRIKKFASPSSRAKGYWISAPLIAQLGKNYANNYNKLITGDELLEMACMQIKKAQAMIGGKIAYLECEDKSKLVEFYSSNGFVEFGKRGLDRDEKDVVHGKYYIQMLKYLGK